ncbi:MAG: PD40 domain-containing protein [Methanobacteriaceae archaeon]|nr:PD40 domain-containing protein [Methanobacteriaceae archaeon]
MRNQTIILIATLILAIALSGAVSAAEGDTIIVSNAPGNTPSNGDSAHPSVSDDGVWVAYYSDASNLVAGDTNDGIRDIFLHNRITGVTTKLTSGSNGLSGSPSISGDGNWVAYISEAYTLVDGDNHDLYSDVFLYDRVRNVTSKVTPLSGSNGNSFYPSVSGDGNWVAYSSYATNLVAGDTPDSYSDIFLYDRVTGITTKVPPLSGSNGDRWAPSISADGNWVAYVSFATNLVANDAEDGRSDIFLYDRVRDVTSKVTPLSGSNGHSGYNWAPSISADGVWVAYTSLASNLVASDTADTIWDIFLYNSVTGVTSKVTPLSGSNGHSYYVSVSGDGNWVAFSSEASNLVANDAEDGHSDIFLYDRVRDVTSKVTPLSGSNGISDGPSVSGDGNWVAFYSEASTLVAGDTNQASDVFMYNNPRVIDRSETPERNNPSNSNTVNTNEFNQPNNTNLVNAATTVGMQTTGTPLGALFLGLLTSMAALLIPRKK